jgi:hypothetical protein
MRVGQMKMACEIVPDDMNLTGNACVFHPQFEIAGGYN